MTESTTNDQQIAFLPFHVINDFMKDSFRQSVIRAVLTRQSELPGERRALIERLTRQVVQVPGFRNSAKAPATIKVKPMAEAFEKNPGLVAAVLAAWAELNPGLRQEVHSLLTERGWEILPAEADRSVLPGFLPNWPKDEDFEALNAAYREKYPESQAADDDVSLMCVWLSGRLPYHLEGEDEEEEENE